jgi:hypothetical protein
MNDGNDVERPIPNAFSHSDANTDVDIDRSIAIEFAQSIARRSEEAMLA